MSSGAKVSLCLSSLNALRRAIRDGELDRGALKVLAHLTERSNATTLTAWPRRESIAKAENLSEKSVHNKLYELRERGYVDWERRPDETRPRRTLLHYHLLEQEIIDALAQMKDKATAETARPAGQNNCPTHGAPARPAGQENCPPRRACVAETARPGGLETAQPGGSKELDKKKEERAEENHTLAQRPIPPHMNGVGFVISLEHDLVIPTEVVAQWRSRFPHIRDLEATMSGLGTKILSKGRQHPGWTSPDGWMVKILADINTEKASKQSGQPIVPSRWRRS